MARRLPMRNADVLETPLRCRWPVRAIRRGPIASSIANTWSSPTRPIRSSSAQQLPEPLEPIDAAAGALRVHQDARQLRLRQLHRVRPGDPRARFHGEEVNFVAPDVSRRRSADRRPAVRSGASRRNTPIPKLEIVKDTLTGTLEYAGQLVGHGHHGLQAREHGRQRRR